MELSPHSPIQYLKGVGEKRAELFSKLSVFDISDLLSLYPRTYEEIRKTSGGRQMFTFAATDGKTPLKIIIFNNVYAAKALRVGGCYLFYGKVSGGFLSKEMVSPEIFNADQNTVHAVYPQTAGLNSKYISKCVKTALDGLAGKIIDPIPADILARNSGKQR